MVVEQWKYYNMCEVALHAMSGCALATLVRAEVVMVETPVTESSIQAGGRTGHRPSLSRNIGSVDGGQAVTGGEETMVVAVSWS